ncbi:hypothetical protein B0O99DRAFT_685889 [Bisporella sp. PMI_857]|nr:hypothetical protein B0O99DRAFT_685889 [Bisporella sp. PMI_857]
MAGPKKSSKKRHHEGASSHARSTKKTKPSSNTSLPLEQEDAQIISPDPSKPADSPLPTAPESSSTTNKFLEGYDVTSMNIISSSHIQQKTTRAISFLASYPSTPSRVIHLNAKAKVAAKMITIVEIAKREIAKDGGKWFQYNKVESVLERKAPEKEKEEGSGEKKGNEEGSGEKEEQEEEPFEVMKTPFERSIEGKPKVRGVPIMSIYLSRVRIERLRREFGEQTNALDAPK